MYLGPEAKAWSRHAKIADMSLWNKRDASNRVILLLSYGHDKDKLKPLQSMQDSWLCLTYR